MRRLLQRSRRSLITAGAIALGASLTLSACGQQSGLGLARKACTHVAVSIRAFEQSQQSGTNSAMAARLRVKADNELRAALALAASANSDDGSWNTLMTTLSEISTVDETHLIPALKAQCAVANANQNVNPENPQAPSGPTKNVNPQN
ncbi:MAG TPA: hypothetical protein VHV57_16990 [Acidimicrobiales bacterium]|nr:hypothetical protein [Acidimicrobiales bacterium]